MAKSKKTTKKNAKPSVKEVKKEEEKKLEAKEKKKLKAKAEAVPSEEVKALETQKEEALTEESSAENAPSPTDGEAEDALSAQDPYEPYRYRWEVRQKDLRRFSFRRLIITLCACILSLGIVAVGILAVLRLTAPPVVVPEETEKPAEGDVVLESVAPGKPKDALTVCEMIEKVKPSVVGIYVVDENAKPTVSTGVIVNENGYILTNYHNVKEASSITVFTEDEREFPASVIGRDELSDIAVLRIYNAEGLVAAKLGDSEKVRQGDWVVAIGTPGGLEFSSSATLGIVSGTDRQVQMQTEDGLTKTYTAIQTDASINPGNSGGPLVNVYGQVIGINRMKLQGDEYEGVGFALPINGVISIANQIIENGRVEERPKDDFVVGATVFGAKLEYFSPLTAEESGLVPGAYVKYVEPNGPAQAAGIRRGDIITVFDGKAVTELSVITEILAQKKAGDEIIVEISREGEEEIQSVSVKLSSFTGE